MSREVAVTAGQNEPIRRRSNYPRLRSALVQKDALESAQAALDSLDYIQAILDDLPEGMAEADRGLRKMIEELSK